MKDIFSFPIGYHCTFICPVFIHSHLSLNGQHKSLLTHSCFVPPPPPTFLQFNSSPFCILSISTLWPIPSICCCSGPPVPLIPGQSTLTALFPISPHPALSFSKTNMIHWPELCCFQSPQVVFAESMLSPVLLKSLGSAYSPPWLLPVWTSDPSPTLWGITLCSLLSTTVTSSHRLSSTSVSQKLLEHSPLHVGGGKIRVL